MNRSYTSAQAQATRSCHESVAAGPRHPITGNEPPCDVAPKNRDSNGIVAAVVDGRQALQIVTSTMPAVRFLGVNADVGRLNSALGVNCLIQVAFPCAVGTVNKTFHRYDERLLITVPQPKGLAGTPFAEIRKLVQGSDGTSSERQVRTPRQRRTVLSGKAARRLCGEAQRWVWSASKPAELGRDPARLAPYPAVRIEEGR